MLVFLLLLALAPAVYADSAKHGSTKLLALMKKDDAQYGAAATLELDIQQGKNRVFLETFPLTQVTTQVSMRFAQQIACDEIDFDCSDYDFFYTIHSLPGVVGGPSAGAAAAVLASALLLDIPMQDDVAITGTINSGGTIGVVGGIKGKIKAASENGIKQVLIPKGTRMYAEDDAEVLEIQEEISDNATNKTTFKVQADKKNALDLVEYGRNLSVNVTEVATLAEAIEIFTGYKIQEPSGEFVIDPGYRETMKDVALDLCSRNSDIKTQLLELKSEKGFNFSDRVVEAFNYSNSSSQCFELQEYYSAASYCFRSSVVLKQAIFKHSNFSDGNIEDMASEIEAGAVDFAGRVNNTEISTLTSLQTMMAVEERIQEAREAVDSALKDDDSGDALEFLAYAEERLHSAKSWSKFFNGGSTAFELDEKQLKQTCQSKINEAEERQNYVRVILPTLEMTSKKDLDAAYDDLENKDYVRCLYKAIKVKSEIDVLLGVIGVEDEQLQDVINLKLGIVKKSLIRAQKKGVFPIISYSYYEYANSLRDKDEVSSLLFTEYALEFASLDIYFPKKPTLLDVLKRINKRMILMFFIGLFAGILIMWPVRCEYKTLQTSPRKRLRGKKR